MTDPQKFAYSDYTVGWICALPETELVAAIAMLDERHPVLPATDLHDANTYALGRIGDHNVVIACLPAATTGKVSAANVAKDMIRSFPAVRFGLMVGIGGGAPYYGAEGNGNSIGVEAEEEDSEDSEDDMEDIRDIRLGDVVISLHSKSSDAVVQYDFGKSLQESEFIHIGGKLNKPPNIILGAVAQLKAEYELKGQNNISKTLADMISSYPALGKKFQYPGSQKDLLFKSDFVHEAGKKTCKACRSQNNNLVRRDSRPDNSPRLHYGTIGSADQVMKDAVLRDRWAREKSIICFEMEAAGLMDSFPCLVIRGICDYADSHKNKVWQPYSAATAASYAKEILRVISGQRVVNMDPIKQIERSIREVHCAVENTSATVQVLSIDSKHKKVFDKLPYVEGSSFDALDAEHDARCHPETRVDLIHQILEWAKTPNQECIFWLNGMAGTGKSTISRTIAQLFKEKGQLGASFFFKRGEGGRDSAKRFFTTICAQLLVQVPALIRHVELAIDADPYLSIKSMKEQFTKLLLVPLLSLDQNKPTTIVIVIDALDECEHKDNIRAILQLLPQLQGCTTRHIRIFLTSRPELPIRPIFEESNNHRCLVLHELSNTVVEKDIRVFLKDELLGIKRRRKVSGEWPGDDVLKTLVKMAVPLFISAATVCRFVDDPKWRPEKRLQIILEDPAATSGSQMDRTYLPVLNQLLLNANEREIKQLKQEFQDIVGVIILLATPLSINTLSQLINLPSVDINNRLDGFHSVLSVPQNINTPVRILHLSFRDFLINTKSTFYVHKQETHKKIASHCLRVMETRLKHNICGLASYGTEHKDIDSRVIKQHLTAGLQYSSRYWVYHLEQSEGRISQSEILAFLKKRFLHWLEVLALIGSISDTVGMIDTLKSSTWTSIDTEISDFLYDAKRFTLQNTYIAGIAPLQLYSSGLVFAPAQSIVKKTFLSEIIRQIQSLPVLEDSWSPALQTLEGHSDLVNSVAFSPDGCTLASGSDDNTIKLWDITTGTERQTLEGHADWVYSVAFSPDGHTLVSGSNDHTIKLWDTTTGTERQTLEGHSDSVLSVAFSPDGCTLASGSADNTIKLWDTTTGTERQTLKGHSHWIYSVAFSPDGDTLVSGSNDDTIKLWDTTTGTERQTLEGHSGSVKTVTFSPDGRTLASGSADNTIKLWDTTTGTERQTLKGHSYLVKTVTFSPDGRSLASGSADNTIKLWDITTGTERQTLKGHSHWVYSVAFSPDGRTLVSGSADHTIKLWDTMTGTERQTLEGHSGSVKSVTFSPDGRTLVSGSNDDTIKLWDTTTSTEHQTFEGHSDPVETVLNEPKPYLHISLSNAWVALGDENLLWLPADYRSFYTHTIKDTTIALGYGDGRVCIIRFHL